MVCNLQEDASLEAREYTVFHSKTFFHILPSLTLLLTRLQSFRHGHCLSNFWSLAQGVLEITFLLVKCMISSSVNWLEIFPRHLCPGMS